MRLNHSVPALCVAVKTSQLHNTHKRRSFTISREEKSSVIAAFDENLLKHLVCPVSKYPLHYDNLRGLLVCLHVQVAYPIRDGIPLLLPVEGKFLSDLKSLE